MKKDQMKKKMAEKEVDSRGGEKRCRRSHSPVASVPLPASEKESSGLIQRNVWTKGSADRDNVRTGDDTIAKIEQSAANAIASINTGKWKDGDDILKDSVTRTKGKVGGKLMSMVWKFNYVSTEKNAVTWQARAKCKFCHFELDERPARMLSHSETCKEILPHDRHQFYTMLASKHKFTLEEDLLSLKKIDGVQSERLYPTSGNRVETSTNLRSHFDVLKLTAAEQARNDALMTKAIIDGRIPFSFIENIFFRRFMKSIPPAYNLPSKWKFINKLLPQQAALCPIQMLEELEGKNDLTLSLDGLEDRRGRSIFAIIAFCRDLKQPLILDIVDLSSMRHTAENLKDHTVQVLQRLGIGMQKFRTLFTDNPAVRQIPDFFHHMFPVRAVHRGDGVQIPLHPIVHPRSNYEQARQRNRLR
uniref:AlNc14C17G1794 protein n=1 Tax=Albugo laibachii Nc14 TaxID=890382 RepID=F0W4C3_9STRA|nr:AlNc14C17G1794 [Albugo laibachii Nc14]|eukprot:CCA15956.1 AlNc14C17G1794 [Albugo laibachii Nc14]